ncbi:hypothetical protein ACQZV8_05695 [Magnetococcales bacterium HHB-1]
MTPPDGPKVQPKNPLLLATVFALIMIAVVELFSFMVVQFFIKPRYSHFFVEDYKAAIEAVTDKDIRDFKKSRYDPELGYFWQKNSKNTSLNTIKVPFTYHIGDDTARVNPYKSDRRLISIFGSSFTFSSEVNDDQTWAYFLSQKTDSDVKNFGMSTYSVSQSLKKMTRELKGGLDTPFVLLSFNNESSLWQTLSSYQVFHHANAYPFSFKPRLKQNKEGGFDWIENPLQTLNSRQDLLDAFEKAKKTDDWYHTKDLEDSFPYTWNMAKFIMMGMGLKPAPRQDQWNNPPAILHLKALITRFYQTAVTYKRTPILLVIPSRENVRDRFKKGEKYQAPHHTFIEKLKKTYQDKMIVIDLIQHPFDDQMFHLKPFTGHASEYGNRIIAEIIYQKIKAHLPKHSQ